MPDVSTPEATREAKHTSFATTVVEEPETGQLAPAQDAMVTPVYRSSIYRIEDPDAPFKNTYLYSRLGNPNVNGLEEKLAHLEQGQHGFCFASGMAAITTFLLSTLQPGDHVICQDIVYGGTLDFLSSELVKDFQIEVTYADLTDPENLTAAIRPNTRLLYLESPTNPVLTLLDIETLSAQAHTHDIHVVVDNTFATPYLQTPLTLGADTVIHSLTKYIGGHSNELGGAVITKDDGPVIRGKALAKRIRSHQKMLGGVMSPDTAWQINQSIKTLPLRMQAHCQNAMAVARFLEDHPSVKRVIYPGLASHPQHALAQKQMQHGFGGVVTFDIDGTATDAKNFIRHIEKPFNPTISLGGVESLIYLARLLYDKTLATHGVSDTMIRASVGIEDISDLTRALDHGLRKLEGRAD